MMGFIKESTDIMYTHYIYHVDCSYKISMYENTTEFITFDIIRRSGKPANVSESLLTGVYHIEDVESDLFPRILKLIIF